MSGHGALWGVGTVSVVGASTHCGVRRRCGAVVNFGLPCHSGLQAECWRAPWQWRVDR